MKKLITTLSAIIAILLVASPVMASAESIDVMALQLSDPIVYMNDEPIADMTGLMLQLAGGSTSDGALTQMFVDVFAGGESVNSAMVQFDENGIAGSLGGMTSAYGVSSETLGELPVEGLNVANLDELLTALQNWTLFDDIGALAAEFSQSGFAYGTPETIEVDLAAGKTSMTYVPMTADLTEFTYSMLALLENDELLGPVFASMAADSGYASITDMLKEGGFGNTFSGGVATTEDSSSVMMEENHVVTMYEEPVHIDMSMIMDGSMGDAQYLTMTYTVTPEDTNESVTMTMNGTIVGEDVTLEGNFTTNFESEDENTEASFSLTYASAAGAGAGTDKLDIAFDIPEEVGMTLSAYTVEATGETNVQLGVKDEYSDVSAYLTFTPAEAADASTLMAGTVDLGLNDGTDTYSITCPVSLIATTINTDDYYIAPENVIDVTTMTEEQMTQAESEMGMVMIQMLTKIEEAVPGLEGLTSGMMGYSQQ
jgi:hypothetical protein